MASRASLKTTAEPFKVLVEATASPSPLAQRLWWHVLSTGRARYSQTTRWGPLIHPGAVLLWVESGTGFLEIGTSRWRLEKGSRFWFFNFEKARTFTPVGTLVVRAIRFAGPGLHAWLEELGGSSQAEFDLQSRPAARVRDCYTSLWRLSRAKPRGWEWQAHVTLGQLWRELFLARGLLAAEDTSLPEPITRVFAALGAEPFRDWRGSELASIGGLGYGAFRRLFQQHMRETVHEFLQRRRVDAAKRLLADRRLQIKAIAQQLHFCSARYFSFFFRSQTGMSPTEFRNQLG